MLSFVFVEFMLHLYGFYYAFNMPNVQSFIPTQAFL